MIDGIKKFFFPQEKQTSGGDDFAEAENTPTIAPNAPLNEGDGKLLARVNHYEIVQFHPDTYIVRDSAYKLHIMQGKFSDKFKLVDLMKIVEKQPAIVLKNPLPKREAPEDEITTQETEKWQD